MTSQLNDELNPHEDISSNSELVETSKDTSQDKLEGFSSFISNVKNTNKEDIPKNVQDIPPVKPTTKVEDKKENTQPVDISDPLNNIGKFIQNQVEEGKENLIPFDYENYSKYFGDNLGYYTEKSKEGLDTKRAHEQGKLEEFKNATTRVALNVIPEVVSQLSNVLDFEDYYNSDDEIGNWLNTAMKSLQQDVKESNPIYRENPNKPLDLGDSAYWFENGGELVTSIAGFVGTGYITGGATAMVTSNLARGTKLLSTLGKVANLTSKEQGLVNKVNTLSNAIMLNQAEGIGIGTETYSKVYEDTIKYIKSNKDNINLSEEDIVKQAKEKAAKAAASAVNFNKINILLNLSSAGMFFKDTNIGSKILPKKSILNTIKKGGLEGGQEYTEELINDISQQQATDDKYNFKKALDYALTDKGVESGLLGFIGGFGQTVLTKAGKSLPIYKNVEYNKSFINEYSKLENTDLSEEEKVAKATEIATKIIGTNKNKVSESYIYNKLYNNQQDEMLKQNNTFLDVFNSVDSDIDLLKNIKTAKDNNEPAKEKELKDRLFSNRLLSALETNTVANLKSIYEGYGNLSTEEAAEKGIYKEGDELNKDVYYKEKVKNSIKKIDDLSNIYNKAGKYLNQSEVYLVESNIYNINNNIKDLGNKIDSIFKESELKYNNTPFNPSKEKNYINTESELGYDINKTTPKFKSTAEYKELISLNKAYNNLVSSRNDLQEYGSTITNSTYQNTLASKINQYVSSNKAKKAKKEYKEKQDKNKVETNTNVSNLQTSLEEEQDNEEEIDEAEKEVDIDNIPTPKQIKTSVTPINIKVEFPVFSQDMPNQVFKAYKDTIENPNIDVKTKIDTLNNEVQKLEQGKKEFNLYFPLEASNLEAGITKLKEVINELSNVQTNVNINNNIISDLQQELIDDILSTTSDVEEDNSIAENSDFNKVNERLEKLQTILSKLKENGVDINNFKEVINSFETNTSKDEVLKAFNSIKYLYNLVTDNSLEGSYEQLILDKEDKESIINHKKDVALFSLEYDNYNSDLDNITNNKLQQLYDLAELNKLDTVNTGMTFETYNETASNLLAYLAKQYTWDFKEYTSKTGKKYIAASKTDIDNLLNSTLDQRVLSSNFIKVGDTIAFEPLQEVTLQDGTKRLAKNSTIDNHPIGISVNGELLEGLYLHDVDWINGINLSTNNKALIIQEQNKLRSFRERILKSDVILKSKIVSKSAGVPIIDSSDSLHTINDNMPEAQIGIIKDGNVYINRDTIIDTSNKSSISDGTTVAVIPFGNSDLALPIKRFKLGNDEIDSITEAVKIYLSGTSTDVSKELDNQYGFNILTSKGLESYINQFIHLSKYNVSDIDDFKSILNNFSDNINITQFSNSSIYYGSGLSIGSNYISKSKNNGKEQEKDIEHFIQHLKQLYVHVNLDLLKDNKSIPFIKNNKIDNIYSDYNTFIKNKLISPYIAIKLDNGEYIYTIQSRIHFDMNNINDGTGLTEVKDNKLESIEVNTTSDKLKDFKFEDVTDEDFSPNIENSVNEELLKNSSLIQGLSIQTQISLIRSITNDIINDYLYNKSKEDYEINIGKEIKVAFDALDFIKDKAITENHHKKDFITSQIDIIKENKAKLAKQISIEINKKIKLVKSDDESDTSNIDGLEDSEEQNSWDDKFNYTINPITTLSTEVKQFLEGIRDRNKDNKIRTNLIGLNMYIPSDIVFNDLLSILGKSNDNLIDLTDIIEDGNDIPNYVKNIISLLETQIINKPYLIDVIDKFKQADIHTQNGFITALHKTHTNHIYVNEVNNTGNYTISINEASYRNVTTLVLSEFQKGLQLSNLIKNNKIDKNQLDIFNNTYNNLKNQELYKYEDIKDWLSIIGIEYPEQAFNNLNKYGLKNNNKFYNIKDLLTVSNGIFKNIHERVNKFNEENTGTLSLEDNNLFEDSSFRNLAYHISLYKKNLFTDNFKDGNGNTVYGWSNNRYVTDRFNKLKTNLSLLLDLRNDIFSKNSYWLKQLLLDNKGEITINKNSTFYKYFKYYTSDSLKVKDNKIGKTVDKFNNTELLKYHLSLFYNQGLEIGKKGNSIPIIKVVYPTLSDKANTFVFQVPGYKFTLNEEGRLRDNDINFITETLVLPELERIYVHNEYPNKVNVSEWQKGGDKFLLFPSLNTIEDLYIDGKLKKDIYSNKSLWNLVVNNIKLNINNELQNTLSEWREANIVKINKNTKQEYVDYIDKTYKKNNSDNAIEVALNYTLNSLIANMNIQQLFIGDIVSFYKKNAIETADNLGKRLASHNAGANDFIVDKDETFNLLVVDDNIVPSTYYDNIKNILGEEVANDYLSINSTDAQEYTTLKEHLYLMVKKGELTNKDYNKILEYYNNTGLVKIKDIKKILNPMKPRYSNNINRDNTNSLLYIKSSSFPLIKELTYNTPLDKLRLLMENNDIHRVAHKSAVKVGLPSKLVNIYENNEIVIPDNWKDSLLLNIPRQGHGIQQEVPYNENNNEVNDGTQQSKLLFTNILDLEYQHPFEDKKVTGYELEELYRNIYGDIFKNKYNKLVQELGFDNNTNTIKNIKKLQKILIEEGINRNYNSNDIAALSLNDIETEFETDIWLNNSTNKFNSLLNSIVDNRIRKRKFRGKSFVLASKSNTKLLSLQAGINGIIKADSTWNGDLEYKLDENNNLTYAEILIPFKFWDNNNNLLKIDNFINEDNIIDLNKIPKELLNIIAYRIPTSGINLITTIKVVGFLPSSYGDIVFAPNEFIVQMGSDFDVDKLYTHMYNTHYNSITDTLEILNDSHINTINSLKESIKTLKDTRIELIKKADKSKADEHTIDKLNDRIKILNNNDLLKLDKSSNNYEISNMILQNKLLDIHKTVLNSNNKEVQKARFKPLSFGNLPNLAKVINTKNSNYFSPLFNSYQRYKYISARAGKTAVGIFSLDMVFNSALQVIQDPVKFTYNDTDKNGKVTVKDVSYNIFNIKNNNLNDFKTAKGDKYKSEVLEGFMTAALDNEKEQLLGKLNINNSTFDFIRAMTQLG